VEPRCRWFFELSCNDQLNLAKWEVRKLPSQRAELSGYSRGFPLFLTEYRPNIVRSKRFDTFFLCAEREYPDNNEKTVAWSSRKENA
jgi:hypothetical protein